MGEFVNFITKGIETIEKDDRRTFSGHISAEVVDHENDFIFVKEILDIMDVFMKHLPVLSEVHSNRMIGKIYKYEPSEIDGHKSVKIYAEVFKDSRVTLYDEVWKKIKDGTYSGLSMGGGSKIREPMLKDGRMVVSLKNLELYEIAVCPSPMNPLALIDKFNEFAKSDVLKTKVHDFDGRGIVQCNSISCEFGKKAEGLDIEMDIDLDNVQPGIKTSEEAKEIDKSDGTGMSINDAGATNPVHQEIGKHTNGINEVAEETRRTDETIDTKLKDQVDENLKTNNMNKLVGALVAATSAIASKVLPDDKEDVEKNSQVPHKKVDEAGEDLEQFDKPKEKPTIENSSRFLDSSKDKLNKHHQVGLTEEQEYSGKLKVSEAGHRVTDEAKEKAKKLEKSYTKIALNHLKHLDNVIEKNDKEITRLNTLI